MWLKLTWQFFASSHVTTSCRNRKLTESWQHSTQTLGTQKLQYAYPAVGWSSVKLQCTNEVPALHNKQISGSSKAMSGWTTWLLKICSCRHTFKRPSSVHTAIQHTSLTYYWKKMTFCGWFICSWQSFCPYQREQPTLADPTGRYQKQDNRAVWLNRVYELKQQRVSYKNTPLTIWQCFQIHPYKPTARCWSLETRLEDVGQKKALSKAAEWQRLRGVCHPCYVPAIQRCTTLSNDLG